MKKWDSYAKQIMRENIATAALEGRIRLLQPTPLTLEQANEKYRGVARIEPSPVARAFNVWRCCNDGSYLYTTCDTLEDAIAACRDLDNAEPVDVEF